MKKLTPKWYKSRIRVLETPAGRHAAIIYHVRYSKAKASQEGRWYYTPAFPSREMARVRARDAIRDLDKGFSVNGAAFPFDGNLEGINLDTMVWRPLE